MQITTVPGGGRRQASQTAAARAQALARGAGLWELAGAASVVTVMVVIFVADRARCAGVVGRGRG
jgi:hypothetical protein